jgi:hypothetical protein
LARQLAVEKQVRHFHEARLLGELVDRIAAVKQDALVAIDIGDRDSQLAVEVKPGSYVNAPVSA